MVDNMKNISESFNLKKKSGELLLISISMGRQFDKLIKCLVWSLSSTWHYHHPKKCCSLDIFYFWLCRLVVSTSLFVHAAERFAIVAPCSFTYVSYLHSLLFK